MAEILLTAVINKCAEIAGYLLIQEGPSLYWLKEDVEWLQREARHIQSYLGDANGKLVGGDLRVKNLIKDIEELAGDMEDILDEFLPKIESHKSEGALGCLKELACVLCHTRFSNKFSMEIEKIKRRVNEINRVRTTFGITDTSNKNDRCDYIPLDRGRLFLHTDETEVIGLDDDFNMLQVKLLDQDSRYEVISIIGMPGVGKTTLAKKLYKHVYNQFECSALVYVSQQPRVGEIFLDISKQVGLTEEERKYNLEDNLRSLLKRKRYVILLDDIWNVEIWDDLKLVVPECDSRTNSKIIITSQNSDVGRYIGGNNSLHMLQPLDSKKSIELFTNRIFTFDNNYWENVSSDLENIGKEIVERCDGIPLAIVLVAGMLRARERTEHAWNSVLETMGQKIQDQCANILALSYNDLPTALRPCFLYFGLFPEDHEISAFDLINMWIAEKFIVVGTNNRREVEDIAEDFLNDLVSRNLIQVSRRTFQGRIASCRIHDLLHSLCVTLARGGNFFLTKDNPQGDLGSVTRLRRLAFYSGGVDEFFSSYPNPKKLRALLYFSENSYPSSLKTHLNIKLLRVLSMHIPESNSRRPVSIPEGIGNLSCLGYLKLWGPNFVGHMPRSIVKFKHLLTLDIEWTHLRIAFDVMEMKQLRHLLLSQFVQPIYMSSAIFSSVNALLPNLQTLIGMDVCYMKSGWLHQLTNLRKLSLNVNNDSIVEVLSTQRMAILPKLEVLKLKSLLQGYQHDQQINLSSYDKLRKLSLLYTDLKIVDFEALPAKLVKLSLRYVQLDTNHISMIKRLPKLKILKLTNCWLPYGESTLDLSGVDSFMQLEVLHIIGQNSWDVVTVDALAVPKLKKVIVSHAPNIRLPERLARLRI
ncbi:toMV resistance protein Tm-2(2)-like [Lycium ferocissimum]|uniref:toMV resistance protein Tm-2(2)-like n=1 Tax=Lycium ferocissimum TaxID=112874 RepID=UPI002814A6FD|nr:toMV resistance protein Tm-2(2)-like [Lycium ferocissimum]XP_059318121.1 toMV resistance protein Tm-2(2)-like [Lycium ferocissimum]